MSAKKASAEIVEFDSARTKHRPGDIDPRNYLAVGPYLEAVRIAADMSIDQIVSRTHIKSHFIEAIDQMDVDNLPSKPFAIGFVRSYAEILGLESEPIIERFKLEAGYDAEEPLVAPVDEAQLELTPGEGGQAERSELSLLSVVAILAFMIWCGMWITRPRDTETPIKLDGVPIAYDAVAAGMTANAADPTVAFDPGVVPSLPSMTEAAPVERTEPVFPPRCIAGAQPIETVEMAFTVRVDGRVVSERVVDSSNGCFERAAINALRQWRFSPRTIDGTARAAFDQRVVFTFKKPA